MKRQIFMWFHAIQRLAKATIYLTVLRPLLPMIIGLALGAVVFVVLRVSTKADSNVPLQVEFRETDLHLGKLRSGEAKSCVFSFRNKGQHPIIIDSIHTSCACTSIHWPESTIAVNQEGIIEVTLSAIGRGSPSELITKLNVYCRSEVDSKANAPIELTVTARICGDVQISPQDLVIDHDGFSQSTQDLVVERDLLDSEVFSGLTLQTPACLMAIEKERSANRVVFQISLAADRIVNNELYFANVEYGTPVQRVVVPIRINHIVRLVPSSFFVIMKDRHVPNLKSATYNTFQIISTKYAKMKIGSIRGGDGLIENSINGSSFSLWLKVVPGMTLYASALMVSYTCEHNGREIHGQMMLPVHILIEP